MPNVMDTLVVFRALWAVKSQVGVVGLYYNADTEVQRFSMTLQTTGLPSG